MREFEKGYKFSIDSVGALLSAEYGGRYVSNVESEISKFAETLNTELFGNSSKADILKGNLAEFWHAGTFNINATVKGSSDKAQVLQSHDFASVDVQVHSGVNAGLKYYKTANDTLKQQAKNATECYYDYKHSGGKDTFDEYLAKRGMLLEYGYTTDDIEDLFYVHGGIELAIMEITGECCCEV